VELTTFSVRNFRNLASLDVEFPHKGVVLVGENAQGKTNLLEAIYYLVLFRSSRGARDRELVRFGEDGYFLAGSARHRVTAGYESARRRKKVTVDGTEVRRLVDAVGHLVAVGLSPADRAIVDGGPAGRRRYLDVLLSLSDPAYLTHLTQLRGALRQRNAALRRGRGDEAAAFNGIVASAGNAVASRRHQWIGAWAVRYRDLGVALGERQESGMAYRCRHWTPEGGEDEIVQALQTILHRDLRVGLTTRGPHRDDLALTLGERELRRFGSAGQQRTAAIALRLLEAETLADRLGTRPIALFDDVFAELDQERQERLLALIGQSLGGQVIVTAPRDQEVPEPLFDRPRWRIRGGRLER
jgi:DNA replication and repair protein RecF